MKVRIRPPLEPMLQPNDPERQLAFLEIKEEPGDSALFADAWTRWEDLKVLLSSEAQAGIIADDSIAGVMILNDVDGEPECSVYISSEQMEKLPEESPNFKVTKIENDSDTLRFSLDLLQD